MTGEDVVYVRTFPCPLCGKVTVMPVPRDVVIAWRDGVHIQRAWPEATADQRELLITGTHAACWDEMTQDEE